MILIFAVLFITGVRSTILWECPEFNATDPLGSCGMGNPQPNWGAENIDVVKDPNGSGKNVLRILYPEGSYFNNRANKGGTEFKVKKFGKHEALILKYDIMFDKNFKFVRRGIIPGFYGGTGKCSGGISDPTCFSTRFLFRRGGEAEAYAYLPPETNWFCNNTDVVCLPNAGDSLGIRTIRFTPGVWHKLHLLVKLNTPGEKNGIIRVRFNGEKVYNLNGLTFRLDDNLKIDTFYFSTFLWGPSVRDVYIYYKNIRVIGQLTHV